jgi:hypothetical protein
MASRSEAPTDPQVAEFAAKIKAAFQSLEPEFAALQAGLQKAADQLRAIGLAINDQRVAADLLMRKLKVEPDDIEMSDGDQAYPFWDDLPPAEYYRFNCMGEAVHDYGAAQRNPRPFLPKAPK